MDNSTKTCFTCGAEKPVGQFQLRGGTRPPGSRASSCKACTRERSRKWYLENKERALKRSGQYQRDNLDQAREYGRAYHARNRQKRRDYSRQYRIDNPELVVQQRKEGRLRNPGKYSRDSHRRRALLAQVPHDPAVTLPALRERDGDFCGYCGSLMDFDGADQYEPTRATLEHLLPISRGGPHTFCNTALCCRSCNVSKHCSFFIWGWVGRLRQ